MKLKFENLKIKGSVLIVGFLLVSFSSMFAQELTPVTWEIDVLSRSDGSFDIVFNASIEEGWHLYSAVPTTDPDQFGPMPTEFIFEENELIRPIGAIVESGEKITKHDPAFNMELNFYENEATFTQKVGVRRGKDTVLLGEMSFMVCDDTKCIFPPAEKIEIVLNNN